MTHGARTTRLRRRAAVCGGLGLLPVFAGAAPVRGQCQEQKLYVVKSEPVDNRFGYAVALDGDVAVMGAYNAEAGCCAAPGLAYVFELEDSVWGDTQILFPWDGVISGSLFGYSLALDDGVIVVGARHGYHDGQYAGSAYVYRYDGATWAQDQKLTAADAATEDDFGHAVAIADNVIVVGSRRDDDCGPDCGSAYVFRYDGAAWVQRQKLLAPDGGPQDQFGFSVDVRGDKAIVGAFRDDDGGADAGAAYVFSFDGLSWGLTQKLLASDGAAVDQFGVSVAIEAATAVVGARWDDDGGPGSGSAYVFHYDDDASSWLEAAKLGASDAAQWDEFGVSVDLDGDRALVGSWLDGDFGFDSGGAYLFAGVSGIDCNSNGTADACDVQSGASADVNGNGIPDECDCPWDLDGDWQVAVTDLLAMLAVWGTDPDGLPDFDGNGTVDVLDLLAMLGNWGACPP